MLVPEETRRDFHRPPEPPLLAPLPQPLLDLRPDRGCAVHVPRGQSLLRSL